jgi:hypothetical protein
MDYNMNRYTMEIMKIFPQEFCPLLSDVKKTEKQIQYVRSQSKRQKTADHFCRTYCFTEQTWLTKEL